jgi:hypothetical protein
MLGRPCAGGWPDEPGAVWQAAGTRRTWEQLQALCADQRQVEHRPAQAQAAGLTGKAANHVCSAAHLFQRVVLLLGNETQDSRWKDPRWAGSGHRLSHWSEHLFRPTSRCADRPAAGGRKRLATSSPSPISPRVATQVAIWAREEIPRLSRMCCAWFSAVRTVTTSVCAMCRLSARARLAAPLPAAAP